MTDIIERMRNAADINPGASAVLDEAVGEVVWLREQVDAEALISGLIRDESSQLRFRNAELEALTAAGGRDEYVRGVQAMATEAKQLCRDFSDRRDRPYMSDVTAAIDALAEQVAAAQPAPSQGEDA